MRTQNYTNSFIKNAVVLPQNEPLQTYIVYYETIAEEQLSWETEQFTCVEDVHSWLVNPAD